MEPPCRSSKLIRKPPQATTTDENGGFVLPAVPLGDYIVTVSVPGFRTYTQQLHLASGTTSVLHFELEVRGASDSVNVTTGASFPANPDSVTPTTTVNQIEIARTPGADRTDSLQMITDYVPGAYVTHDMLHMRGGHQVSWLIDGVQIPNTNIASNPWSADRSQRHRHARDAEGKLPTRAWATAPTASSTWCRAPVLKAPARQSSCLSAGSFLQTNDQLSLSDHTANFAYYTSVTGNRSDYGLSPPVEAVHHDAANGYGGFASLLYNRTPMDQFRLVTQLRTDYFQIPTIPTRTARKTRSTTRAACAMASTRPTASPLLPGRTRKAPPWWCNSLPSSTTTGRTMSRHRRSSGRHHLRPQLAVWRLAGVGHGTGGAQTLQGGLYSFGQHDTNVFGSVFNDGSAADFQTGSAVSGGLLEEYVSDSWLATDWLTLNGGLRLSHFVGSFTENEVSPRIGAALQVPRLHWVLRGFYGRFYQPPPLLSISGPIASYADNQNTGFLPLHGERDEEHQFGVQIPFRGWLLDADTFETRANNFLDHSNLGESSIYYPVSIDGALINGWELTLNSPRLWRYGQAHLAYSNQTAKQRGDLTGGLVCVPVASPGCDAGFAYSPLDHDQRNTLTVGFNAALPRRVTTSLNVAYGSGFHNGSPGELHPGDYLAPHTSVDLSVGKTFRRIQRSRSTHST